VYGLDFRVLPRVLTFTQHVLAHYEKLDILINNAAQTIRRPPAYYTVSVEEERLLEMLALKAVARATGAAGVSGGDVISADEARMTKTVGIDPWSIGAAVGEELLQVDSRDISSSGASTMASLLNLWMPQPTAAKHQLSTCNAVELASPQEELSPQETDAAQELLVRDDTHFPPGASDGHGEQLDLRTSTSWTKQVGDIHPVETVEVQLVNNVVPTLLVSMLMPLLKRRGGPDYSQGAAGGGDEPQDVLLSPRFIVNVSSPEGQFGSDKTGEHVHTNMAKAALNMLTYTLADTLAPCGIFITSVDTGWVTRMRPGKMHVHSSCPPLSDDDGAARVMHPIFHGVMAAGEGEALGRSSPPTTSVLPYSGVLLQNFAPVEW
jgi:NAD(P)-dependent dehydrogenase (short-subunit alcohol dehydrogenase family)